MVLDREPSNALTRQVYRELRSAAQEVSEREDVTSVILFGGHETFSVGDDVAELRLLSRAEAQAADLVRGAAFDAIAAIPCRPSPRSPATRWARV